MKYSKMLRELFPDITLKVDDLFHLEAFQIKYLPERVPVKEFSVLIRANPFIQRSFYPYIDLRIQLHIPNM